jgi:hypothetical protein
MIPVIVGLEFLKTGIGQSMEQTSWVDVLGMAILLAIYFQRLGRHLKDTNTQDGEQYPPPPPQVPQTGHSAG